MHRPGQIPPELIVSMSSAAATSLGPFTAGGWQGAPAGTPGERSSIPRQRPAVQNGAAGLLTVALVLITVTLAARAALDCPGRARARPAGRTGGGAQHHDRTAGHVDFCPAGQYRRRTA